MRIADVKTVLLAGPSGRDPYLQALRKCRSAAFIEIHTDTEMVGIGETYIGYFVPEIMEFFKPILVGISDEDLLPKRLRERMYRCGNFWCRTGLGVNVLAGLEGALWDLRGRKDAVPVHHLGGRRHDRLLGYATGCASEYP
jgi:L-alanine-DL-glutamate epimerase-like enolase superfamily enzyme